MLRTLITTLKQKGRVIIAIDEGHHCTGSVLNVIKTMLNQTEALMILAGMNTLLRKLRATSSEEAKQLMHNRLFAKLELSGAGSGRDGFLPATSPGNGSQ